MNKIHDFEKIYKLVTKDGEDIPSGHPILDKNKENEQYVVKGLKKDEDFKFINKIVVDKLGDHYEIINDNKDSNIKERRKYSNSEYTIYITTYTNNTIMIQGTPHSIFNILFAHTEELKPQEYKHIVHLTLEKE